MVSVVVPSRNEKYLYKTTKDLLAKARGDIEITIVLDGYWPPAEEIVDDPRVNYIYFPEPRGMRAGINAGVALSKGEYIMKCDAHCMFAPGFDETLVKDHQAEWVVVPRRYPLDPENWELENRTDNKYPIDVMSLTPDFHGMAWPEGNTEELIQNTPSSQGSCWFMKKSYFEWLELEDEATYGKFWNEFQEIGLKVWLSGGEVKVNKKTWYAHWHKTEGRGYSLNDAQQERATEALKNWKEGKGWHKQKHPFSWLGEKFPGMPGWK